jgi:hypothetical protein
MVTYVACLYYSVIAEPNNVVIAALAATTTTGCAGTARQASVLTANLKGSAAGKVIGKLLRDGLVAVS